RSGSGADGPPLAWGRSDAMRAARQMKRYPAASMQDQSPIIGLTHASYAMAFMDFLEESVGREAIKTAGFDPLEIRRIITGLQDQHAERLRACDPFITKVLELEKSGGRVPRVLADGAAAGPAGAC